MLLAKYFLELEEICQKNWDPTGCDLPRLYIFYRVESPLNVWPYGECRRECTGVSPNCLSANGNQWVLVNPPLRTNVLESTPILHSWNMASFLSLLLYMRGKWFILSSEMAKSAAFNAEERAVLNLTNWVTQSDLGVCKAEGGHTLIASDNAMVSAVAWMTSNKLSCSRA